MTFSKIERASLDISDIYCMTRIHEIHVFDHALKNLSYTVHQGNDRLEQESGFLYKETMHINYFFILILLFAY